MVIMTFLVLLGPAVFMVYHSRGYGFGWQLMAMTWEASYWDNNVQIFLVQPYMLMTGLLLLSLRPVFAYQMVRCYNGRTTKLNTLLVGVASELQILVVGNLALIVQLALSPDPGQIMVPLFGPIPVLFLTGLVIMNLKPPSEITTPWQQMEERKQRWDKDAAAPESKPAQSSSKEVVVEAAKEKQDLAEAAED
jgi:hypothetical protein